MTPESEQIGSEQTDSAVAVDSVAVAADTDAASTQEGHAEEDEEEEEEDYIQRHLLSLPKSQWSCLEDSQQTFCLAMNRQKTVFAVGEREGRISVWDNVSIRVITRELDPTLIALPDAPEAAELTAMEAGKDVAATGYEAADKQEHEAKESGSMDEDVALRGSGGVTPEDEEKEDDSATNDDGSVEADDDMDEEEEEDEEEDVASVEEGDANTEEEQDDEEDDEDEDMDDMEEDEEQENDEASSSTAAQKKKRSTRRSVPTSSSSAVASGSAQSLESDASSAIKQHSNGLSLDDLRVVKTSLKVVTYCAWSCDTRWLFAGCEEKGNRRGRLCVWDIEAASIFATFGYRNFVIAILHTCIAVFSNMMNTVVYIAQL